MEKSYFVSVLQLDVVCLVWLLYGMAAVITHHIPLDVSSDPLAGALNLSANNARFEINLEQGITIPSNAFNAQVEVDEATVWNTVHNISAALGNNKIYIFEDGVAPPNTVVTIPDGNYSTPSLSSAIDREYILQSGGGAGSPGLIFLNEDFPTERVLIQVDGTLAGAGGAQIDFTPADTFRDILGFDSQLVPAAPTTTLIQQLGDNRAGFNTIEFFIIHWNGGEGIRINSTFQQALTRVNITAPPGSQIVSQPNNPAKSSAIRWVGSTTRNLSFWLTDHRNEEVDTGEIWSARLNLSYQTIFTSTNNSSNPNPDPLRVQIPFKHHF